MQGNLADQLADAKERLANERELRKRRVALGDELKRWAYRLREFETDFEVLDAEVARLSDTGVIPALTSLLGRRQARLDRARAVLAEIEASRDQARREVESHERELADVDRRLEAIGDAEADYARLCEAAERSILDRRDESSDILDVSIQTLEFARGEVRAVELALEASEFAIRRLADMSAALDRVRKKRIRVNGAQAIASIWNDLQRKGADDFVGRVRDGLDHLNKRINDLYLHDTDPVDAEINRLSEALGGLTAELTSGWSRSAVHTYGAGNPIEDAVQSIRSFLQDKLEDQQQKVSELESERLTIIQRHASADTVESA